MGSCISVYEMIIYNYHMSKLQPAKKRNSFPETHETSHVDISSDVVIDVNDEFVMI